MENIPKMTKCMKSIKNKFLGLEKYEHIKNKISSSEIYFKIFLGLSKINNGIPIIAIENENAGLFLSKIVPIIIEKINIGIANKDVIFLTSFT